jgi:signal transduction histidine kinase
LTAVPLLRPADSLRSRLLFSGFLAVPLAAVLVATLLGSAFERSMFASFDRRLADDLLTVIGQVSDDGNGTARLRAEPLDGRYSRAFSGHYWEVRHGDRRFYSRSLWDFDLDLPPATEPDAQAPGGPRRVELPGPLDQRLRAAIRHIQIAGVDGPVQVLVASEVGPTLEEIRRFRLLAAIAGALVAAALVLGILLQAGYALGPLRRIRHALESLRRGSSESLEEGGFPSEIRPLAEEINALLLHHQRMVERARAGAADLAHALKTPLAVLQAAAERSDPELPRIALEQSERMRVSIDRHLAVSTPTSKSQRTRVAEVIAALKRVMAEVHRERGLTLDFRLEPELWFRGDREDLEEMLGNLIDNACKWARSRVSVESTTHPSGIAIRIRDDGPGIEAAQLDRVRRRGVRLDERMPGSGLGLAIVSRLAESHGGGLELRNDPEGGLCARLTLPGSAVGPTESSGPGEPDDSRRG